jgi:hypothetical protein
MFRISRFFFRKIFQIFYVTVVFFLASREITQLIEKKKTCKGVRNRNENKPNLDAPFADLKKKIQIAVNI